MNESNMTYRDLLQIVELVKTSTHFREFRLKTDQLELDIKRGDMDAPVSAAQVGTAAPAPAAPAPAVPAPAASASPATGLADLPADAIVVTSPMVGTFYRAPEPGAAPYVEVGQQVGEGDTVCLIEVMKLINSIPAPTAGTVTHILVADGEAVEYGQPLIALKA